MTRTADQAFNSIIETATALGLTDAHEQGRLDLNDNNVRTLMVSDLMGRARSLPANLEAERAALINDICDWSLAN